MMVNKNIIGPDILSAVFFPLSYEIESANPAEIFITTCHEARHAYQHTQIRFQEVSKEEPELKQKWKVEFENYNSPKFNNPADYVAFLT
jgi:S-adenosylmethionine synthetase